jgi:hypothetical protein
MVLRMKRDPHYRRKSEMITATLAALIATMLIAAVILGTFHAVVSSTRSSK